MAINITPEHGEANLSLIYLLEGKKMNYTFEPHPLNRMGTTEGTLTGGNLSLLYALTGTSSDLSTAGKILFIEDLEEYLYHIDRMMMTLKRTGKLKHLSGLVVGGMNNMNDNVIPYGKTAEEIIAEHCEEYDFPVCYGFPTGHIPLNQSLKLGVHVKLFISSDNCCLSEY
jgi:muramoyltetrapeptide carboxypeptidase